MYKFELLLTGNNIQNIYNVFVHKTKGTNVGISKYQIINGSFSFILTYDSYDSLLFSIIKTLKLCSDWKFTYKVYELLEGTIQGRKRIIYF